MVKKNYKISVLITNFNKLKFLKKTILSIINQNYKNYEIILFDDCSTDGSTIIAKELAKKEKFKIIINKKKKFKSSPLNQIYGILESFKKSKGEIICLLDGDDYFYPKKLYKINQYFEKEKNMKSVFNYPKFDKSNFNFKKRDRKNIWPTIFPTSCISIRRSNFKKFIKLIKPRNYSCLEIDARFIIFSKFYNNEYNLINNQLTKYNNDKNGITSNVKKFSKKWWLRRNQAYEYLKYILNFKKTKLGYTLDIIITSLLVLYRLFEDSTVL